VHLYPPNWLFRKTIFRPQRGAAPRNFYTRYRMFKACWRTLLAKWGFPNNFFQKGRGPKIG